MALDRKKEILFLLGELAKEELKEAKEKVNEIRKAATRNGKRLANAFKASISAFVEELKNREEVKDGTTTSKESNS